MPKVRYAVI